MPRAGPAGTCKRAPEAGPGTVRLIEKFDAKKVEGASAEKAVRALPRTEWRFDAAAPAAGPTPPSGAGRGRPTAGLPGHARLRGRPGRDRSGRPRRPPRRPHHHRLPRSCTSSGRRASTTPTSSTRSRSGCASRRAPTSTSRPARRRRWTSRPRPGTPRSLPWRHHDARSSPGDQMQTYTITPPAPVTGARIRHLLIRPTDAAGRRLRDRVGAARLPPRAPGRACPSGVSWQGLRDVFRETLVTRAPGDGALRGDAARRGRCCDLALGHARGRAGDLPGRGAARRRGAPRADPHGDHAVPLGAAGGGPGRVRRRDGHALALRGRREARHHRLLGRARGAAARRPDDGGRAAADGDPDPGRHAAEGPPRRSTATSGRRRRRSSGWREEGALFRQRDHADELDQGGHAVGHDLALPLHPRRAPDPRPAAGLGHHDRRGLPGRRATRRCRSRRWPSPARSRTCTRASRSVHEARVHGRPRRARAGPRPRASTSTAWWSGSRTTATCPSFVYLHFFDPHPPYEPNRPYDTLWADPKGREEYLRQQEVLKKFVADPFLAQRGMATRDELVKAGLDPAWLPPLLEGLVRRLDPRDGRRRSPGSWSGCAELGLRAALGSSPSTPTTARSSTTTAGCGTARASTAR